VIQGLIGGEARVATDVRVNRPGPGTMMAHTKMVAQVETTKNPMPRKRHTVIATAVLKGAVGKTLPKITTEK
jgi:hypothetical protein